MPCCNGSTQTRLDANPEAVRRRRETDEHPFGTMKARLGATQLTSTFTPMASQLEAGTREGKGPRV